MSTAYFLAVCLKFTILFAQNAWGSLQHPYTTYRNLTEGKNWLQVTPIVLLCVAYFSWTTLVHVGIRSHPLILSFNLAKLTIASIITFFLVVSVLVWVSRLFGGKGSFQSVVLPWTYSLLPTLLWFFTTSLLWFLFPPPRTVSWGGQALSVVFLVFSWFLFFWKGVLYYLTLRFGMRLDLLKILGVSAVVFPLGFLYSIVMYRLGIFRVPFL